MTTSFSLTAYLSQLLEAQTASETADPREEGLKHHRAGEAEAALPLLLEAEAAGRPDREVSLALAHVFLEGGQPAEAIDRLETAAELEPTDAWIAYALGEAHRKLGDAAAAEAAYRRAVALRPTYTDAHIQLGVVLAQLAREDEAIRSFEQAIFLDRQALVARYQLAKLCLVRREFPRVVAQLHVIKQLRPDYAPAYVLAAEAAERQGQLRQALVELGHLVKRRLADGQVYYRIGLVHWKLKEVPLALAAFVRAIAFGGAPTEALCYAAQAHESLNQLQSALELYQRLMVMPSYQLFGKRGVDRVTVALTQIEAGLAA